MNVVEKPQTKTDHIWEEIRSHAEMAAKEERTLSHLLHALILNCRSLEESISRVLAEKLYSAHISPLALTHEFQTLLSRNERVTEAIRDDLDLVRRSDPACDSYLTAFLYYKGFHALQTYRIANTAWHAERFSLARFLQSRASEVFSVDIHPAAQIGSPIFIDHGTGVVIGETAIVEAWVHILHAVTLGGRKEKKGKRRHPRVEEGVFLGAGSALLGAITVGKKAKVGAGSIVLRDVSPGHTVTPQEAVIKKAD